MPAILLPYQQNWVNDHSRFKIGMFARQTGKTFSTTFEIAEDVARADLQKRRSNWLILSRGERQAKEALDEGVKLHLKAFDIGFESEESSFRLSDGSNVKNLEIITKYGSKISALPANADTARGYSRNVFLDEFAYHENSYKIWSALFPVISRSGLKLRITSTPNGRNNKFADLISGSDPVWSRHIVDIYKAVKLGLGRNIEELKTALDDVIAWKQEFELNLDVEAFDQFIEHNIVYRASQRSLDYENNEPLVLGVDVARYGDDNTIFCFRKGKNAKSLPMQEYHGLDTMQVAGKILEANSKQKINTTFIDGGGVGGGVVDRCRELGLNNIVDVNFGAKSDDVLCFNKRAEMYSKLKNWLESGSIANDIALHNELSSLKFRYTEDRKIKLEPKEELKKRIGKSPDKADALALTFAYPVVEYNFMQDLIISQNIYDPLANFSNYDPFSRI